jgi:hypothetical protein
METDDMQRFAFIRVPWRTFYNLSSIRLMPEKLRRALLKISIVVHCMPLALLDSK